MNIYICHWIVHLNYFGTSLVVQRLRLQAPIAGGTGSIPGWQTRIPYASWRSPTPTKKELPIFTTQREWWKLSVFKKLLIHTHHTDIAFCFSEHYKHIRHPRFADLPNPGIEPTSLASLALQADALQLNHGGSRKQLERSYEKVWRGINDRSGLFLIWSNGSNGMSLKAIFLVFQQVPEKQKHLPPQQIPA